MSNNETKAGPIMLNLSMSVDALNHIISELSKPVEPVVNLIADLRNQALTQLEALKTKALEEHAAGGAK